jgi:soluble lytic murein transglycosylase
MARNRIPVRKYHRSSKKILKGPLFIARSLFALLITCLLLSGCNVLEGEFFGKKFGGTPESAEDDVFEELQDTEAVEIEDDPDEEQSGELSGSEPVPADESPDKGRNQNMDDIHYHFSEAMRHFDDEAYMIAEYYLNRVKDNYLILQDHIFYYLAKSLLMQEKFDGSEEYYEKVLQNFPDSIWLEKSSLELADLYYIREDHAAAEEKYIDFINVYPDSDYLPYALYQFAICLEKNERMADAFTNLKRIWLEYPSSEYAYPAYQQIQRLEDEGLITAFSPSVEELFARGESLFYDYQYRDAIDQFDEIISGYPRNSLSMELYSSTCFRLGMSYYNLFEYEDARKWLSQCYEQTPGSSVSHAALFFLGRAYTNLHNNAKAISNYQKMLAEYPSSSYGDDALYRMGRIYSIDNNTEKAIESFEKVFEQYPSGDKTDEALWELGWIQYKSGYWSRAKESFSNMASLFKGTRLQEKALYWQAKCHIRLEEMGEAADLCKQIIGLDSYSYYTFAAQELALSLDEHIAIPAINTTLSPDGPGARELLPGIFADLETDSTGVDGWVDHITKALELIKLGFYDSAALEIRSGTDILDKDPERVLEIATLYYSADDYSDCLRLIYDNIGNIKSDLSDDHLSYTYYLHYPYGYKDAVDKYSKIYDIDPLFALAVIRQESNFMPDAGSYAGARGLMQIMPATGKNIANQISLPDFEEGMLSDPEININMGAYYLRQQLDNFDQSMVRCLGAYNGGPGSMSGWISRFGTVSEDEFIEHITFLETKEYIKKVMGNYYFYRMLYPD